MQMKSIRYKSNHWILMGCSSQEDIEPQTNSQIRSYPTSIHFYVKAKMQLMMRIRIRFSHGLRLRAGTHESRNRTTFRFQNQCSQPAIKHVSTTITTHEDSYEIICTVFHLHSTLVCESLSVQQWLQYDVHSHKLQSCLHTRGML